MLEGEISQMDLIARLVELWREQFTGAIRFESDGIIKIIYFKSGDILSASTNDRADSVDEILMRAGKVSREHVKQALAKRKENETLGDALLNLGFITRKELTWARRVQVVGVIRSIAAWETGSFTIVADYLPKRDEGTLFPLPQVLVELIVTDQDRQKFERAMDGGSAVYDKTDDFDDVFRRLGLNEQAESIVVHVDGAKSVADVATASGGDTFNVYKLMHALALLGILRRSAQPQLSLDDFAATGVADAADMWSEPEPQPQPTPIFELDEAEALRQPTMEIRVPEDEPEPAPATSAWDDEEEEATPAPPPISPMPAWDTPPRQSAPMPIPAPVEPPAEAEEEWGFDEAQIETARRGAAVPAAPVPPPPAMKRAKPPSGSRLPLLLTLMLIFILAAAGYFGFRYWQGLQEKPASDVVVKRPAKKRPAPAPAPIPVQPAPATMTIVEATTTTAATQTVPPPEPSVLPKVTPRPMTVAAEPSPTAAAASPSRERFDAMARDYAANASGNYTVQIQILCDPSNLGKAMTAGGEKLWFVPQSLGARSCYRVFWGRYNTRDEAQRALAEVPAGLRDPSAAVKAIPKG